MTIALNSGCPRSGDSNPGQHAMKSPIFLFGSGRCGSTLLQRAFNAHPDVVMHGEHEGFLGPLANSFYKLTRTADIQRFVFGEEAIPASLLHGEIQDLDADICWVNSFTEDHVYTEYRRFLLRLLASDVNTGQTHWGFKEIRYVEGQRVIWFLREMFPDARFIFLFRNPANTIASGMTAWGNPEKILANADAFKETVQARFAGWASKYQYLLNHEQSLGDDVLVMRYEDLIRDPGAHLDASFDLLGLETPALALEVFEHKVASTEHHEHKAFLIDRIHEMQRHSEHAPLRELCARMGYEHRP